jgi:hypothetical protein
MFARTSIAAASAAALLTTGGVLLALPASAGTATHTLTFTAVTKSQASLGKKGGASFDHDVNAKGKVIGYDVVSFAHGNTGNVAVALKGGMLYAHLVFAKDGALTGTVTGGTGKYAGSTGSVKGQATAKKKTSVTVTYRS